MVSRTDPGEPSRAVIEQAAAWQAQLADESCDDTERSSFDAWLNADPTHRIAFDRMGAIAGRMVRQDPIRRAALHSLLSRRRQRAGILGLLLLVGAGLIGTLAAQSPAVRSRIADERSPIGDLKSATFASGDRITLDSGSAADLDDGDRTVRLWQGAVMAKVQHGSTRPFVVRTPHGSAVALGTQFSVRIEDGATIVAVVQSRVEACADRGARPCLTLAPGQSARLDDRGAHRLADIDPAAEAAWSEGLLVADDMPVAQLVERLNRYRTAPIRYRAGALDGLSLSGSFPLRDTDRALASIGAALPVTVEATADGPVLHRR